MGSGRCSQPSILVPRRAFSLWGDGSPGCDSVEPCWGPQHTHGDTEVMLGTQHPWQAVPSLQFHRDAAACLPLSGCVSLSPLHTPVGNREPILELCKVFLC